MAQPLDSRQLRAFVVPPMTGNYTFWIASDDSALFLLSTNENPANASPVASVMTWTSWREFTKEPNQQSAPMYTFGCFLAALFGIGWLMYLGHG